MRDADPTVDALETAVYQVATSSPEADATLSWQATTVLVVRARGGGSEGLGWSYTAGAAGTVVRELLEPVVLGRSAFDPPAVNTAMVRAVRNVGARA